MDSIAQDSYQAALLMLLGMGFVYLFLTLLIITIHFVIRPLGERHTNSIEVDQTSANLSSNNLTAQSAISVPLVAAISSAVDRYRNDSAVS